MSGSADRSQPATHTLRIPADLGRLAEVRDLVRAAADDAGATDACTADMVQAVDEATTNAIIHGHSGGTGWVEVAATSRIDQFVVTIADDAAAFDPTSLPAPDLSVHPAERRPGGMGVLLARLCVDEMTYRPRPGGGNILTLVRKFERNGKEDR
jgi:anti-sigma regulatory factor (Ser/Thr protein kinase)